MKRTTTALLAGILSLSGLFSCSAPYRLAPSPGAPSAETRGSDSTAKRKESSLATERPGLATGWGEERKSQLNFSSFTRASSKPAGTDVIYYNDKAGFEAMTSGTTKISPLQTAAGDLVEWGIKGSIGFLATYKEYSRGNRLVTGNPGSNYSIVIKNRSKSALEIVASVDGLDVNDGKFASFSKKGYIVQPGDTLEIDGFRTSYRSVAAFKFSSVANSYANMRHGDTRNVGVIGIAVFTQKGVNPWTWMPEEVKNRYQAQPFAQAPQ